jgi:hypothetical protein
MHVLDEIMLFRWICGAQPRCIVHATSRSAPTSILLVITVDQQIIICQMIVIIVILVGVLVIRRQRIDVRV